MERIERALHELPETHRTVATLYFVEDLDYRGIANSLGIPPGTVRSRLHRARRMLQKHLWDVALDHGVVTEPGRRRDP